MVGSFRDICGRAVRATRRDRPPGCGLDGRARRPRRFPDRRPTPLQGPVGAGRAPRRGPAVADDARGEGRPDAHRSGSTRTRSRRRAATSRRSGRRRPSPTASVRSPGPPTGAASRRRRAARPARPPARAIATPRETADYINAAQRWAVEQHPARHPDADPRGSAARLCRPRRDQLPAGDRARQHLGPGAGRAGLQRRLARDARARRQARPCAGGRRRPRPALGSDRGDLRRGSLSGERDVAGGDSRLPGHETAAGAGHACSSRSST